MDFYHKRIFLNYSNLGVSLPIFNVLFGQMLDKLNSPGASFQSVVNELCLVFVYIGIANVFTGYLVSDTFTNSFKLLVAQIYNLFLSIK